MLSTRMAKLRDTEGFTLIELLIVVVIIGILAAIAIPQFSSTKEKAYDASAKSDLRNVMTAQEAHFADFTQYANTVQATGTSNSTTLTFNGTDGVNLQVSANSTDPALGFEADASHNASDAVFCVEVGDGDGSDPEGSGEIQTDGGTVDGSC